VGPILPQVAQPSEGLPPLIRPARISRAGTDEPLAPVDNRSVRAVFPGPSGRGRAQAAFCPPIACLMSPTITIRMPPPTPPEAI
jgi:hypothetical protein